MMASRCASLGALVLLASPLAGALRVARCTAPRVLRSPIMCDPLLEGPFWDDFTEEANAEAESLGLSINDIRFRGGKLEVRASGAGVDQLQQLNRHLSEYMDTRAEDDLVAELPPFLLEVSSPGLSNRLESDMDFAAFKGFPVRVVTTEDFKKKSEWDGTLVGRDAEHVSINVKGRPVKIPAELVSEVRLPDARSEAGDPYS